MSSVGLLSEALLDGFVQLSQGNFAFRFERSFQRDDADRGAFLFNSIAEELERIVGETRANELRLESTVNAISSALTRVVAGDFAAKLDRDFRGDPADVLAYLVNSTVEEFGHQVAENRRRAEESQLELERQVEERTRQLAASEASFRTLFEAAPVAMCLIDQDLAEVIAVNAEAELLLGTSAEAIIGQSPLSFLQADDRKRAGGILKRDADAIEDRAIDVLTSHRGLVHCLFQANLVELGGSLTLVASLVDLTERKRAEDALRELAQRDPLTSLLNRRSFSELANDLLARGRAVGSTMVVAMVDVDHFKVVNDRFGHTIGDLALQRLADCMTASVRTSDLVARYGGEEFALAFAGVNKDRARATAERIRSAVEAIEIDSELGRVPLTVSIGLSQVEGTEPFEDALKRADQALYEAKEAGRNRVHG